MLLVYVNSQVLMLLPPLLLSSASSQWSDCTPGTPGHSCKDSSHAKKRLHVLLCGIAGLYPPIGLPMSLSCLCCFFVLLSCFICCISPLQLPVCTVSLSTHRRVIDHTPSPSEVLVFSSPCRRENLQHLNIMREMMNTTQSFCFGLSLNGDWRLAGDSV